MDKLVPQSISLVIASLLKCNGIIHVIILDKIADNTGPKPFNIGRKPPRRTRVWAFWEYTTRWCGNGCPHVRPHPGLTNLQFGRVYLYFR